MAWNLQGRKNRSCPVCAAISPPYLSLPFGAVFSDPASVGFSVRAPETSGVKIVAVSWRSGLLPPGFVQITAVDRVEAEIIDETKYSALPLPEPSS